MTLKSEQVFYGRGECGYGIIGESPGATPFRKRVEALCGAIGTPDADYGGEPFLLSVPEVGHVFMVCGRRGEPDSMGRATLFFHALIAEKDALIAANADAFSLFEKGAFAGKIPDGEVVALTMRTEVRKPAPSAHRGTTSSTCGSVRMQPTIFRAVSPAPNLVRPVIVGRANDIKWATFSFQPLNGFDVQVLPPRVLLQATGEQGTRMPIVNRAQEKREKGPQAKHSAMFTASLVANAILAALCVCLYLQHGPCKPEVPHDADTSQVERRLVEVQAEAQRLAAQVSSLESENAMLKTRTSEISEEQRDEIEALRRFRAEIPVDDINVCLDKLSGYADNKKPVKDWLNSINH